MAPYDQGSLPIEPGTRLGPYEVQAVIGQGAMGVVYRAYHAELERVGAVKVLQAIAPDRDSKARFQREAQAIAHMRHPNILNVYDFGEHEGTPYMIVEFVPGGSLADRLQRGPVDRQSAIAYLRGIAEALDYAHSLGIVHRDVKPANVLLGPEDTPILADFGLAKLLESTSIRSITGITTGTPAYMSPEQVMGIEVGPAADRYSLATIAYELLTGAYPFDGQGVLEMLYAHVHREPPKPSSINRELGPAVDGVILRGLAKQPDERWKTCEAFVAALESALNAVWTPALVDATPLAPSVSPARARASGLAQGTGTTAVLSPDLPATRPVLAPTSLERTVAVAAPVVAAPVIAAERRSRRLSYAMGAALLIAVLLIAGFCGVNALRGPTLALSPATVRAGDQVVVTAGHLPANQAVEIQMHSSAYSFPVRSDKNGDVTATLTVPRDTPVGDHTVRICWSGACHAQATLHVVAPLALGGPGATPSPARTQSPSPSPASATSAPPSAAPGPGSTPPPYQPPSPQPQPQPSPAPSPRPSSSPAPVPPSISLSSSHIKMLTGSVTVYGQHFGPGKVVTITFAQGATNQQYQTTAASDGTFAKAITVPATAVAGQATITACAASSGCASQSITVTVL